MKRAGSALLALPLAVVSDRFVFPGKSLLGSFVLVPMILPPFVGAIGIKQIFGQYGAFNALRTRGWQRMLGLLAALAIASLPYGCPLVPGMFNMFSGGLVFVLAELTIFALFLRGMLAA